MEADSMEIQQHIDNELIIKHGEWKAIDKQRRSEGPKGRFNHIIFTYKDHLYIHGGTSSIMDQLDNEFDAIYRLSLQSRKWEKITTSKPQSLKLEMLNSHCGVIYKNEFIVFGGSNSKGEEKSDLVSLNLETMNWVIMQQKGQPPSARQNACMVIYKDQYLIMYGGIALLKHQMYNDFYFYHIKTKTWTHCQGNYQYLIQSRSSCSMCLLNNKIYIFGGEYETSNGQSHYLNDFYEVIFTIKGQPNHLSIDIKLNRIITNSKPSQRSGHTLIPYKEKYIFLFGGEGVQSTTNPSINYDYQNNIYAKSDCWMYSEQKKYWFLLQTKGDLFKHRCLFGSTINSDKIYIFGGIKTYENLLDDTICLDVCSDQIDDILKNRTLDFSANCRLCYQKKHEMIIWPFELEEQFVKSIVDLIEFPFSAFGLLLDNCIPNLSGISNLTTISYEQLQGEAFIKIQDTLRMGPACQYISSIVNFQIGINFYATGIDKKMKHMLVKEALKKQFGLNLKLGSLRLGDTFLYVNSCSLDEIRVTLFRKQKISGTTRYRYVCYFYCYNSQTGKLLQGYSQKIKESVEKQYQKYILSAIDKKSNNKNTLYIFDLRKILINDKLEPQLQSNLQVNDLIYGQRDKIFELENYGYCIYECCDISLRSYLNLLYLKKQNHKILMNINNYQKKQIQPHIFLDKIDKMVKNKLIIQLDGLVNLDCKINELYFNPDLKRRVGTFHNGVLIYHKGRLINRYKYSLGNLLQNQNHKPSSNNANFLGFFGFFEVPDSVPVNMFKTDFIYDIMVQKLYSRFKFAQQFLHKKNNKLQHPKKNFKVSQKNITYKINPCLDQSNQQKSKELKSNEQNQISMSAAIHKNSNKIIIEQSDSKNQDQHKQQQSMQNNQIKQKSSNQQQQNSQPQQESPIQQQEISNNNNDIKNSQYVNNQNINQDQSQDKNVQ